MIMLRQQLSEHFGDAVASDEQLLEECINMCEMFNLSAEDLFYKWEAFDFNSSSTRSFSSFTADSAKALKSQLQRDLANETSRNIRTKPALPPNRRREFDSKFAGTNLGRTDGAVTGGSSVKLIPRLDRSGIAGRNETLLNSVVGPNMISFKGPRSDPTCRRGRAYKYMYEKVSERSGVLDGHIDEFAEIVRDHYNVSELDDPATSTENDITVVGKIIPDPESGPVKLSEACLALESSRMMGSGVRIPLRFDPQVKIRGGAKGAGGIGLFPGAIVSLRGKNGGSGCFLANEVLTVPRMKSRQSLDSSSKPETTDSSFSMCIASGPYTLDADLRYKPWHQFLEIIKLQKPAVVLLLGPFVDYLHPKLKNGDTDQSPAQLFQEQFSDGIRDFLEVSPNSNVLLVPSVRDVISDHAAFPQCELGAEFAVDSRVLLLPNPCRFSINEVSFAATTVDVLFHLRREEYFKRGEEVEPEQPFPDDPGDDVMANLCRHLLQQRSFYPIFPVPVDLSHEVNLDVSHAEGLNLSNDNDDEYAPDIFILPSRLKSFKKMVYDTAAVNPSFLIKGQYATLNFDGQNTGTLRDQLTIEIAKM